MANEISDDHAQLMSAWQDYRDGIYDGDVAKLRAIFHPSSSMFYNAADGLVVVPVEEYFNVVANRDAPAKTGAKRRERLVSIVMPSPDNAVLVATILISGKSFTDQLVFMKVDGRWLIVAKTYHLDSDAGR